MKFVTLQSGWRELFDTNANTFSLGTAKQGEDFHTVLSPDSQPIVRLYTMEDMEKMVEKVGRLKTTRIN